jgi:hypothetical protein
MGDGVKRWLRSIIRARTVLRRGRRRGKEKGEVSNMEAYVTTTRVTVGFAADVTPVTSANANQRCLEYTI